MKTKIWHAPCGKYHNSGKCPQEVKHGLDIRALTHAGFEMCKLAKRCDGLWRDRDDSYWLMRLVQEVGELASSLACDHDDTPEHELKQIGSIAINWLAKREAQRDDDAADN